MKSFEHVIKDDTGMHARPAGALVKTVAGLNSVVTVEKDEKSADAKKLFALLSLGIKCDDKIKVYVEGEDEEKDVITIKNFFEENL